MTLRRYGRPTEQTKVQALNESIVFGVVAFASLGAGWLYDRVGWATMNIVTVPMLVVAPAVALLVGRQRASVAGAHRFR